MPSTSASVSVTRAADALRAVYARPSAMQAPAVRPINDLLIPLLESVFALRGANYNLIDREEIVCTNGYVRASRRRRVHLRIDPWVPVNQSLHVDVTDRSCAA